MQACLPGKPQPEFHAVDTALWEGRRIVAYVSGSTLVLLRGSHGFQQSIAHSEHASLRAVAIDSASGKIATTDGSVVFVHRPLQDFGELRWSLQDTYSPADIEDIACLSWGLPGEVLVGGTKLALLTTDDGFLECWKSTQLANTCKLASFSHDASLVASTGWHDRLVKIWRRGFIGGGNERFDPVYLSHPGTVTSLRWRGRPRSEEHADVVLYTTCTDGYLRVWTAQESHCLHILDLWTELDLVTCIQPRSPLSPSPFKKRYAFIIDKWDFQQAIEDSARLNSGGEREQYTREHLREIAANDPEICIVLDDAGNMSAWGLERVGCKSRFKQSTMNIGHAEDLGINFEAGLTAEEDHAIFRGFASSRADGSLEILGHFFDGRVQWLSSQIEQLFDPSPRPQCMKLESEFTGHSDTIEKLTNSEDGKCLASRSETGEIIFWRRSDAGTSIVRQSASRTKSAIIDVVILNGGGYAVVLEANAVSCWDLGRLKAFQAASAQVKPSENSHIIAHNQSREDMRSFCLVSNDMKAQDFVVKIARDGVDITAEPQHSIFGTEPLTNGLTNGIDHQDTNQSETLKIQSAGNGLLATTNDQHHVDLYQRVADRQHWSVLRTVDFHLMKLGLAVCCKSHAAAVDTSDNSIVVWDSLSQHCELKHTLSTHETVESLVWHRLPSEALALAVVLSHRVLIFLQIRLDLVSGTPTWRLAKDISLTEVTTMPIAQVVWSGGELLVIAAGSSLFTFDTGILPVLNKGTNRRNTQPKKVIKLDHKALLSNGDVAIYHPQSVLQHILLGDHAASLAILQDLHSMLKFWTETEPLSSTLNRNVNSQPYVNGLTNGEEDAVNIEASEQVSDFDQEAAEALDDRLESLRLPWITASEQQQLRGLSRSISKVSRQSESVDAFGLTYICNLGLESEEPSILPASPYRSTVHALLSASQDILLDQTVGQAGASWTWKAAHKHHTALWLSSRDTLLTHFETIARAEYTKSDDRNPVDCSLFYLALRKKQVLQGLWRMAHGHREREQTTRVLAQNFEESRWKSAALKNAYALLGKRRAMYAAAWFLLAGEGKSAVNVLIGDEINDLELAVSVARVYDGDQGNVLKSLLKETLLPRAVKQGDKWMAIYGFSMLKREDLALQACVRPLSEVVQGAKEADVPLEACMWWKDDPNIITVYRHLKDEWFKNPLRRGQPFPISAKHEKDFVKATARTFVRMGCSRMALDLLRTWSFTRPTEHFGQGLDKPSTPVVSDTSQNASRPASEQGKKDDELTPPSMLIAFESRPVTPAPPDPYKGRKKVTEEPSANSILDSFDF